MIANTPALVIEYYGRDAALAATIKIGLKHDERSGSINGTAEHLTTLWRGAVAVAAQRPVALHDLLHGLRLTNDAAALGDLLIRRQPLRALQTLEVALRVLLKLEAFAISKHGTPRRIAVSGETFTAFGVFGQVNGRRLSCQRRWFWLCRNRR